MIINSFSGENLQDDAVSAEYSFYEFDNHIIISGGNL